MPVVPGDEEATGEEGDDEEVDGRMKDRDDRGRVRADDAGEEDAVDAGIKEGVDAGRAVKAYSLAVGLEGLWE